MARIKTLELAVGLFFALALAAFFMLALWVSNIEDLGTQDGYQVSASFENIGRLKERSPVTMAGVRIGRVTGIDIDKQTYEAIVTLSIMPKYDKLPSDSSASILTSGLLGEQYIGLEPGGSDAYLKQGDRIKLTQSAFIIENLIGRFLTGMADRDRSEDQGINPQ